MSKVLLEPKNEFYDGTTHLLFDGLEFMKKLAGLVTRPRINQLIYHGVFAPNASWRVEVVAYGRSELFKGVGPEEVGATVRYGDRCLAIARRARCLPRASVPLSGHLQVRRLLYLVGQGPLDGRDRP